MTIRTDTMDHAIDDISDARLRGANLADPEYACVELDDGDRLRCVEREPGQWQAWSDVYGTSHPL